MYPWPQSYAAASPELFRHGDWKKLDENVLGEFGVAEVFKQFLGKERADDLAPLWAGDRYAIFEHQPGSALLLVVRMRLSGDAEAARYFGGYSDVLERKDQNHTALFRRPNFFSFDTPDDGGVFLRCFGSECLSAEGTTRVIFDAMTRAMGWPPARPIPATPVANLSIPLQGCRPRLPLALPGRASIVQESLAAHPCKLPYKFNELS